MKVARLLREKFEVDRSALVGVGIMALFASLAGWRWAQSGHLFFALLLFKDLLWSVFLLTRKSAQKSGSRGQAILAYVSTALPLLYFSESTALAAWRPLTANVLAIFGFLLATLATIELGSRVGVSPAARGEPSREGVYRWFRHPMYTGYIVAELGWILIRPENVVLFLGSIVCYALRMRMENRVFAKDNMKLTELTW